MSWMGALFGVSIALGLALVLIGLVLAMGTMKSQRDMYRDQVAGNYGVAAILVIIGAVLLGAVLGA